MKRDTFNFKNESGFTLVQTLVSMGLMGILFVAGFKLFQQQTKLGASSSFQFESIIILDEMKSLLNDPQSCEATFKGLSAIYEEVNQVKRFNPLSLKAESEFEIFGGTGPVYGQGNVTIHRMTLKGENNGFNYELGYVLLNVTFKKLKDASNEFSGAFPIRVEVDDIGRITHCESSPGLHQERTKESEYNPWKETKDPRDGEVVQFNGESIRLGDIKEKSMLNVEGGISLRTEEMPEECLQTQAGLMGYDPNKKVLWLCSNKPAPILLHGNGDYLKEQSLIKIRNNSLTVKKQLTEQRFRVCHLTQMRGPRGRCSANPINPKEGQYLWELIAQYEAGQEVSCDFLCGN